MYQSGPTLIQSPNIARCAERRPLGTWRDHHNRPDNLRRSRRDTRSALVSLWSLIALTLCLHQTLPTAAAGLPDTLVTVKRGVVAVGTFMRLRAQPHDLRGSGFVVAGNHAITNAHVLPPRLDSNRREVYALFLPAGQDRVQVREAVLVRRDETHDLALLRFGGAPLPPLTLGKGADLREGEAVAFTGYPILNALGLFPATHQGIVSAIAPIAIPVGSARDLTTEMVKRLSEPFNIIQLDATAYPGNSGSPLYTLDSGRVVGVINSVFIKGTKEVALSDPSGITYAIPVEYVRAMLQAAGIKAAP